jgi:hypothetical protein
MGGAAMTRWTVADVMAQSPCYDKARVRELWAGREALSVHEVLDLDIPIEDRLWAAWRMVEGTPEGEVARVSMLTRIITVHALPHPVTRAWAEAWLSGADQSRAASAAASDAARAASDAAWAASDAARAASDAAWAASDAASAASDAASAAASDAAWAARAAAWAVESEAQVADLRAACEVQR